MSSEENPNQLDFVEKGAKKMRDYAWEKFVWIAQSLFSVLFRKRSKSSA